MTAVEILTIAGILLAPVVAIQVSGLLERRRAKHERRFGIFRTLMAVHAERPDEAVFRNPNGVYMKLCNFLRLDPSYEGEGLQRGGKQEERIWEEFASDRARLRQTAALIRKGHSQVTPAQVASECHPQRKSFQKDGS